MTDLEFKNENNTSFGQTSESKTQIEINSQTNSNHNLYNEISLISLNNNDKETITKNNEFYPTDRKTNSPFERNELINKYYKDNVRDDDNQNYYNSESRNSTKSKQNSNLNDNYISNKIKKDNYNINQNIKKNLKGDFNDDIIKNNSKKKDKDKYMPPDMVDNTFNNKNIQIEEEKLQNIPQNVFYYNQQINNLKNNKNKKKYYKNRKKKKKKKCCDTNSECCVICCGSRGFLCLCVFCLLGFIISFIIVWKVNK